MIPTNEIPNADYIDNPRCPRCGSHLLHNGVDIWCSFVGGGTENACSFGLDYDVSIDGLSNAIAHESQQHPDPTGAPVFGHPQVDEAFRLWANMLPPKRRQLAKRMAAHGAGDAFDFSEMIVAAVFPEIPGLLHDAARHDRIRARMLKSIATVDDEPPVEMWGEMAADDGDHDAPMAVAQ